jgi:hypothetical protein
MHLSSGFKQEETEETEKENTAIFTARGSFEYNHLLDRQAHFRDT